MRTPGFRLGRRSVAAVALGGMLGLIAAGLAGRGSQPAASPRSSAVSVTGHGPLLVGFVENHGQWDSPARFVAARQGLAIEVSPGQVACGSRQGSLVLCFEDARTQGIEGVGALPGYRNYFLGSDPARWRSRIRVYQQLLLNGVWPGVDVRLQLTEAGLRYDLLLARGADLSSVRMRCAGVQGLAIGADGGLVLQSVLGPVRQTPPVAWHESTDGARQKAPCRFVLLDDERFGFELVGPRADLPLVVDPGLDFFVFLGGSMRDPLWAAAEAPDGSLVVSGQTEADYPVTPGVNQPISGGGWDGVVARMDARARTLLWATYLGGNGIDTANALAVNESGEVLLTGETSSLNFPATPGAVQPQQRGWSSAFVSKLSPDGTALLASTYLGGAANTIGRSIAPASGGDAVVTGYTLAGNFPVTPGVLHPSYAGAFVTRVNATATALVASTFFGGSSVTATEVGLFVAVDGSGYVTLGGKASVPDLPTTPGAFQPRYGGNQDAFLAILDPGLSSVLYCTYLGGSGFEDALCFAGNDRGQVAVVGNTGSSDLPGATGALQGVMDCFMAVFDPFQLVAGRYLNAPDSSGPLGVAIDSSGVLTISSGLASPGFPATPGCWQPAARTPSGVSFSVVRMGPDLDLWYASYFGGSVGDAPAATVLTRDGWTVFAGRGASPEIPTPGVFNTTLRGQNDGFVARMDMLPAGASRFGRSTPACHGALFVDVTRMPAAGIQDFDVVCSAAPPGATGWLLLGVSPDLQGTPVLGATLHVSLSQYFLAVPAVAGPTGFARVRLPLLTAWRGVRVFAQYVWLNPQACPGSGPLSASHALDITVQ